MSVSHFTLGVFVCVYNELVCHCDRTEGRFFYGMPASGASQWIYTHPEEGAPRTGEGIFPMEVVEVVQVGWWVARCAAVASSSDAAWVDIAPYLQVRWTIYGVFGLSLPMTMNPPSILTYV